MSYRNKTYVAFASENIGLYRLMEAWRENRNIDFNFYDAHDLYISRDTSLPQTIKRNLRSRMSNAKQVVLIGTPEAKKKGGDGKSFWPTKSRSCRNLTFRSLWRTMTAIEP